MPNGLTLISILGIINHYNDIISNLHQQASSNNQGRAYGGFIRAVKGRLVENIAENLVRFGWENRLYRAPDRLSFKHKQYSIPINQNYVDKITDSTIKNIILTNKSSYYYRIKPDIQVYIDDKFRMGIECKAFTENAMLKRILVDFTFLKEYSRDYSADLDHCILLQLESQLGGNYSNLKEKSLGSPSTLTLLSYFGIDLKIITLLEGERKVDKPIHKAEYYKPLTEYSLNKAVRIISNQLKKY